jgi:hypothetical protein
MALKAKRPSANSQVEGNNEALQNEQEQTQTQASVPATRKPSAPPASSNKNSALADLNAGILDNIDDLGSGGNYVTMDGSEFLYKASNESAPEIEAIITYGKRFYQWYDEDNSQYHNSDTKLDDRYKMKFEIRWYEEVDEEAVEHIMTLPTASAMRFIDYVRDLAKNKGLGVGQVVTKMTISRQQRKDSKDRYSRTEFEMVSLATEEE